MYCVISAAYAEPWAAPICDGLPATSRIRIGGRFISGRDRFVDLFVRDGERKKKRTQLLHATDTNDSEVESRIHLGLRNSVDPSLANYEVMH